MDNLGDCLCDMSLAWSVSFNRFYKKRGRRHGKRKKRQGNIGKKQNNQGEAFHHKKKLPH